MKIEIPIGMKIMTSMTRMTGFSYLNLYMHIYILFVVSLITEKLSFLS